MPDVIDLSTLAQKSKGVDYEDLSPEEQAEIDRLAEENNPEEEGEQVRTAFLVVVAKDGTTVAVPDLDFKVIRDHLPSVDEIFSASSVIAKDIQVQETAVQTAQAMQQMAMAQMQARANQQLASQLNLKGGK